MAKKYVLCRQCGTRNDRAGGRRKCSCGAALPKRRVPKHAQTLRDHSYAVYCKANEDIHGVADESCGACGKPRSQERRHDRDHDHKTGKPRGLACGGNQGCNVLMLPWISAKVARAIADAKLAEVAPDRMRWFWIASYLERVEQFYRAREAVQVG